MSEIIVDKYKKLIENSYQNAENNISKQKEVLSLSFDYKTTQTELCLIGQKYDTDKSSQRNNVSNIRHCHPYTIFYDSIFNEKKHETLNIAEFGILDGASLLMWKEYFPNSTIYGFEFDTQFINNFKERFDNDRIFLSQLNIKNEESIKCALDNFNVKYDIIIEDTTHQFEDQIRAIENSYKYLKPGGILIIEDIFKSYNENDYIKRLNHILHHFQDYYFISLDHYNRNSTGCDNDKLFILVKNGAEPIFKNNNKVTIITPSYRYENLINLKNSINFDYINEWIIVYDGNKIEENPKLFENENNSKIKEYLFKGDGISGNPQRNFALDKITIEDTFIYYLDDDNIIHPNFYNIIDKIHKNKFYTFNQENGIQGNNIKVNCIDTGMALIDYKLCKGFKWELNYYNADGMYLEECYNKNKDNHIFINNKLCYYNYILKK
jgi:predicted O-methyltransferase YrrM